MQGAPYKVHGAVLLGNFRCSKRLNMWKTSSGSQNAENLSFNCGLMPSNAKIGLSHMKDFGAFTFIWDKNYTI